MIVYRSTAIFFVLALVSTAWAYAEPARPDGHWQGVMKRESAALTVRFDFLTEAGTVTGRFTSETQRALEYRSMTFHIWSGSCIGSSATP
jgi:hypothetical protein